MREIYSEILDEVEDILISLVDFPLAKEDINLEDGGLEKMGLNSLIMVRLVVEIENKFDIDMDFEHDMDIMKSMSKIVDYIIETKNLVNQGGHNGEIKCPSVYDA